MSLKNPPLAIPSKLLRLSKLFSGIALTSFWLLAYVSLIKASETKSQTQGVAGMQKITLVSTDEKTGQAEKLRSPDGVLDRPNEVDEQKLEQEKTLTQQADAPTEDGETIKPLGPILPRARPAALMAKIKGACKIPEQHPKISAQACATSERLTIAAVGDLLLHGRLQIKGYKFGFETLWQEAIPFLKVADIAYANLEGPTAKGINRGGRAVRDPGKRFDKNVYSSYPLFNYHPDLLDDLKASGFDIVSTANNHSMDRRGIGLDQTHAALEAADLSYMGSRTPDSEKPLWAVLPTKFGNIAWVACTYSLNGFPNYGKRVLMCYEQRELLLKTVSDLSARRDIAAVIVTPHWGVEYSTRPTARQKKLARDLVGAGALAVIGAHPHVVEPWEIEDRRDGQQSLLIYSTGNFVSGQVGLNRLSSLIAWIELCPARLDQGPPEVLKQQIGLANAAYVPTYMHRRSSTGPRLELVDKKSRGQARLAGNFVARVLKDVPLIDQRNSCLISK